MMKQLTISEEHAIISDLNNGYRFNDYKQQEMIQNHLLDVEKKAQSIKSKNV